MYTGDMLSVSGGFIQTYLVMKLRDCSWKRDMMGVFLPDLVKGPQATVHFVLGKLL